MASEPPCVATDDSRRAAAAAPVRTSDPQVKRAPLEQPVTAPAPAGLDGKTPLEGQSAFAAITAAEKEVTRRWRDTVLPKLGQPVAGAAPLGERMYAYLTKNPGGRGRNHTVIPDDPLDLRGGTVTTGTNTLQTNNLITGQIWNSTGSTIGASSPLR